VFASGRGGEELLAILESRWTTIRPRNWVGDAELAKITVRRLGKLVTDDSAVPMNSAVTTHVLDAALGRPAVGVARTA